MHDLVIKGGRVVDGTGASARTADVAIDGGTITAVGKVGAGRRTIDADGLLVTPGFVDIHTHYDAQVTWDARLTPSSWHGVTTVVMGSCGVGFAPAAPDRHDWLIGLMEGVEDIPGAAMHEGITWEWESFPEYLDAIARTPRAIDYAAQIPHGAVRGYVMGDRGAANEQATAEDIDHMYRIVREGLEAGALGFSTSRTMLHKAIDGRHVPGTFAARDELFGIGRALRDARAGVFQLAADHQNVPAELEWMGALAHETGRPVMFNLSQIDQAPELWREGLRILEQTAASGAEVYAQVAGRAIGVMMSWHLTAHPFALKPTFMQLAGEPRAARVAKLSDPAIRRRIIDEQAITVGEFETFVTTAFHKMYVLGPDEDRQGGIDYEPDPAQSVAAVAARTGQRPEEVAYDALMSHDTDGMIYFPLFNYAGGDLELLHGLHQHPRTLMGLSDAGAHCGAVCDGGMPTFMLTHWTRDRTRGAKLPLEHVVRRQTMDTAFAFGLNDRGVIAAGMKADLNVIDYERLAFERPEVVHDLPAGGRRLIQRARGYVGTIVSGTPIAHDGKPTSELPGRLVRGQR